MAKLEERMKRFLRSIGGSRRRMKERINALEARVDERMIALEARVDERMIAFEARINERIIALEARVPHGEGDIVEIGATPNARQIDIKGVPSFTFCTHGDRADHYISSEIAVIGIWEPLETEIVRRLLAHYRLFVDLGANIGWYSAIANQVLSDGSEIVAFEPEIGNFTLLQRNTANKTRVAVSLEHAAVADRQGQLTLHLSETNQGDHRIYSSELGRQQVEVNVVTLDDYFLGRDLPPMLLKCDTQGSEPKIVRGARKTIAANLSLSTFIFEFWPFGMAGAGEDVEAFVRELMNWPHMPLVIDGVRNCLTPVEWPDLLARCKTDLAPETREFVDLLLVVPGSQAFNSIAELIVADERI